MGKRFDDAARRDAEDRFDPAAELVVRLVVVENEVWLDMRSPASRCVSWMTASGRAERRNDPEELESFPQSAWGCQHGWLLCTCSLQAEMDSAMQIAPIKEEVIPAIRRGIRWHLTSALSDAPLRNR
jgi:hypothetical protein